ncbi:hypothetical protein EDD16DRAFT_393759 [Pisolithus croceorrhizus]|nr:hypothetical protein EDD16DRAFT_393759 [Pisolithus croceorrhizus]
MRPYAIYEHPDFSVSSGSITKFRKVATALTVVAASSAAVYEILVHKSRFFLSCERSPVPLLVVGIVPHERDTHTIRHFQLISLSSPTTRLSGV